MAQVLWKRVRTLGKGGFGVVSLASTSKFDNQPAVLRGVQLPSLIAIKSCMLTTSQSLEEEREFLRIIQDSPYIIRCFGANVTLEDGVILYNILLEYASDGSLADRLQNYNSGEGLPEFEVKKHIKNVLLGLSHVHSSGIIHCDIKPGNILVVGTDVTAKIADFGLAMTLEQSMNKQGLIRGTVRYMAPESVLNDEYGPPVDIWALGCTVYELITGIPLWESDSGSEEDAEDDMLYKIRFEEPKFQNPKLSKEAQDFLKTCLVKNPSSRWTADMLLNHPFLLNSSKVAQPAKTRTKQSGYMTLLRRPNGKLVFKKQPHIRDLVVEH